MALRIVARSRLLKAFSNQSRLLHFTVIQQKLVQFILSDIGEGIREVTVRDWFVKVGDRVSQFDNICLVESDKASVNITSRYDGVVKKIYHEIGDTALVGRALVDIDVPDDSPAPIGGGETEQKAPADVPTKPVQPLKEHEVIQPKLQITPAVRRLAYENNVPLDRITGTGKGGRIMKEDVLQFIETQKNTLKVSQTPKVSSQEKIIPITGIKKVMVKTMTQSNAIPSFGYSDEIDVTKLVAFRNEIKAFAKNKDSNVTYMPFFIKALSKSLEQFPDLNATVDANCENIYVKEDHNIGVAIDTADGLIVPNIKGVQNLSIMEISSLLNNLISKAKEKKLSPSDLTGGTFTISNVGIIGGTYVRPLIYPPEIAILGVGKILCRPIYDNLDQLVKASILNVSWSADHRVIDGATMARFANAWKKYVEHPLHLTLEL